MSPGVILLPACMPRSRGQLLATLDSLDVEHRPEWQPGFGGIGWTHCNQAAEAACKALECPLPPGLMANGQGTWLDSAAGRSAVWVECSAARAGERAELGYPTLGTLHEEPHGHILVVVPAIGGTGLHAWQAGRHNYSNVPIGWCLTAEQQLRALFHTHD